MRYKYRFLCLLFGLLMQLQGQMFPPATGGGASLPSQTGNSGKFLGTDGTNAAWSTVLTAPYGLDITAGTSANLDHNYGTKDAYPMCVDAASPYEFTVPEKITYPSTNRITVLFNPAFTGRCGVFSTVAGTGGGGGGGAVSSVFGRTGAVTAATNDYSFSQISGTLAINQGGTGATTAAAARVALLPSLSGNGSKCLAANSGATDVEFITCASGGGGGTVDGTSLLGAGTVGDPLRVNPATVPTRITGTASLTMSTFTNSCEEGTITVSGAATGDEVMIGAPNSIGAGLLWSAYVSSANTVTLRVCRVNGTATLSGVTFRATIVRSF